MSQAEDQRKETLEWVVLNILRDHPKGLFAAELHREIEKITTISLGMRDLLDTLLRLTHARQLAAEWIGVRQRFSLP